MITFWDVAVPFLQATALGVALALFILNRVEEW